MKLLQQAKRAKNVLPAFDREVLARHTMQDAKLQREVLDLFFSQLAKVRALVEQGPIPIDEARVMAHTLLGAASAVGAKRIEAIAARWHQNPECSQGLRLEICKAVQEFLTEAAPTSL